jgi:hypothetical protein
MWTTKASRKAVLASLAVCGLLAGMTGCSSSGPAPSSAALLKDARTAFDSASSVKISGLVSYKGTKYSLNLAMFRAGDVSGTIGNGSVQVTLIVVHGKAYEYISRKFFNQVSKSQGVPAAACALICDKYIAVPAGHYGTFNLASMTRLFDSTMPKSNATVKVTTFGGQPAYELTEPDGSQAFIAQQGRHNLLAVRATGKGSLTFTEWNSVPPLTAPPASKIAKLPGLG